MPSSKTRRRRRGRTRPGAAPVLPVEPEPEAEAPRAPRRRAAGAGRLGAIRERARPQGRDPEGRGRGRVRHEPWPARSLAVMLALVFVAQLPAGAVHWLGDRSTRFLDDVVLVPFGAPPILLVACIVAMPIARRITRAPRSMGTMEALSVGLTVFLLALTFAFTIVGAAGGSSSAGPPAPSRPSLQPGERALPTPVPPSAAATPAVVPASPSTGHGAPPRPSGSPTGSPSRTTALTTSQVAGLGFCNVMAFFMTLYAFPILYRLLYLRGARPPRRA